MDWLWTRLALVLTTGALLGLAGCGGSDDGKSGVETGSLSIGLTDGPIDDALHVWIQFEGLELISAGDGRPESYLFDPDSCDVYDPVLETCTIDLLALQGTEQRTVFAEELPVGVFEQIRLLVNAEKNVIDSYVEFEGPLYCPLYIPSGAETGLKLQGPLQVVANGSRYILDVDLYESIIQPPGLAGTPDSDMCVDNYLLQPVIRIVDETDAGSIGGEIDPGVLYADDGTEAPPPLFAGCENNLDGYIDDLKVYIFEDFVDQAIPATLDDYDAEMDSTHPVASVPVNYDTDSGVYSYEAGYLLTGNYLLGLACNASLDDPTTDEFVSGVDMQETCDAEGDAAFCFIADRAVDVEAEILSNGDFPAL